MLQQQQLQALQGEIEATRHALACLQKGWPTDVMLCLEQQSTIYAAYPQLFMAAFPALAPDSIRPLAVGGQLFANALLLSDMMVDGTYPDYLTPTTVLRAYAMQMESYHVLYQLFPPQARFWQRWQAYLAEFTNACITEQRFARGARPWSEYTEPLALQIAIGKNGMTRAAIAGLAELAQDDHCFSPLIGSIDQYNIARQLFDDLCDWKEDLRCGLPSLLLGRMINTWSEPIDTTELAAQIKDLGYRLYYGGHAQYILELALTALDRADALIEALPLLAWSDVIADLRRQCQSLLQDIDRIIQTNVRRLNDQPVITIHIPPPQGVWQHLAWDALDFLIRQWQRGFGEARHIMHLSPDEGFSAAQEYHYGDVFQRALITDALCDATAWLGNRLKLLIEHETNYLVSCRLQAGVGGWSYFPTVPEIAPDADDLGQIMQALLRAGRRLDVEQYCTAPLMTLLRNNVRADGGIETWIIPAMGRSPLQERQAEFNCTKWGSGPDAEVMANLLYALALYEPERFSETIHAGIDYLESLQDRDGSWQSRWYYGPYYGTYVVLRLLALVRPNSAVIPAAHGFLTALQQVDGGWRVGDNSDPLSTALALLGLAAVQSVFADTGDYERATRALTYLQCCQQPDRAWAKVAFIRPRASEPYESRTVTSLYILKAALAWHRLMHNEANERLIAADSS